MRPGASIPKTVQRLPADRRELGFDDSDPARRKAPQLRAAARAAARAAFDRAFRTGGEGTRG